MTRTAANLEVPLPPHFPTASLHRIFSNLQTIFCRQHRPLLFSAGRLTPSPRGNGEVHSIDLYRPDPSSEFSHFASFLVGPTCLYCLTTAITFRLNRRIWASGGRTIYQPFRPRHTRPRHLPTRHRRLSPREILPREQELVHRLMMPTHTLTPIQPPPTRTSSPYFRRLMPDSVTLLPRWMILSQDARASPQGDGAY